MTHQIDSSDIYTSCVSVSTNQPDNQPKLCIIDYCAVFETILVKVPSCIKRGNNYGSIGLSFAFISIHVLLCPISSCSVGRETTEMNPEQVATPTLKGSQKK